MKKLLNMLIAIGGFIAILIVAVMGGAIGKIGGKVANEAIFGPSLNDIIGADVREINKELPIMIDAETRLDRTTAGPGQVLGYEYTLVKYSASQLDASSLAVLERKVTRASCNQQQNLLSKNISIRFRYTSADGYLVRDFTINPNGCGHVQTSAPVMRP